MIEEIIYTSASKGMKHGTVGFCTVASTQGMSRTMIERLETLCGYRHPFAIDDPRNPVNYSHLRMRIAGQDSHILSRIADAGSDYSGRTNKIAHQLALRSVNQFQAGPARLLAQPGVMVDRWNETPGERSTRTIRATAAATSVNARTWKSIAGDAGWAGWVADQLLSSSRPLSILFPAGTDVLSLLVEVLDVIPPSRRWDITFSTYFTKPIAGTQCQLRFVLDGTEESAALRKDAAANLLDLASPLPALTASKAVDAVRSGQSIEELVSPNGDPTPNRPGGRRGRTTIVSDVAPEIPGSLPPRRNSPKPKPPKWSVDNWKSIGLITGGAMLGLLALMAGAITFLMPKEPPDASVGSPGLPLTDNTNSPKEGGDSGTSGTVQSPPDTAVVSGTDNVQTERAALNEHPDNSADTRDDAPSAPPAPRKRVTFFDTEQPYAFLPDANGGWKSVIPRDGFDFGYRVEVIEPAANFSVRQDRDGRRWDILLNQRNEEIRIASFRRDSGLSFQWASEEREFEELLSLSPIRLFRGRSRRLIYLRKPFEKESQKFGSEPWERAFSIGHVPMLAIASQQLPVRADVQLLLPDNSEVLRDSFLLKRRGEQLVGVSRVIEDGVARGIQSRIELLVRVSLEPSGNEGRLRVGLQPTVIASVLSDDQKAIKKFVTTLINTPPGQEVLVASPQTGMSSRRIGMGEARKIKRSHEEGAKTLAGQMKRLNKAARELNVKLERLRQKGNQFGGPPPGVGLLMARIAEQKACHDLLARQIQISKKEADLIPAALETKRALYSSCRVKVAVHVGAERSQRLPLVVVK